MAVICDNTGVPVGSEICKSCVSHGCEGYKQATMLDICKFIEKNYEPVEDKPGYVWFSKRNFEIIKIETLAKSLKNGQIISFDFDREFRNKRGITMKIITAIENYYPNDNDVCVFLAGGITNCPDWQKGVIDLLSGYPNTETLCVFNPRRENFPIHDPNASLEQINWEYKWLERMDIFSMYFSSGESDQPICMYELGRNIIRMQNRFPNDWKRRIVISVEDGYKRKRDVNIQTGLATGDICFVNTHEVPDDLMNIHAESIYQAYRYSHARMLYWG